MRRHRTDLLSLFSGLTFAAIGGFFLSGRIDVTDMDAQWLSPALLILGGMFIFMAAFRRDPEAIGPREDRPARREEPGEAPLHDGTNTEASGTETSMTEVADAEVPHAGVTDPGVPDRGQALDHFDDDPEAPDDPRDGAAH